MEGDDPFDPSASHGGILELETAGSGPSHSLWLHPAGDLIVIFAWSSHWSAPLSLALLLEA